MKHDPTDALAILRVDLLEEIADIDRRLLVMKDRRAEAEAALAACNRRMEKEGSMPDEMEARGVELVPGEGRP